MNKNRGSALVEFVITVGVLSIMLSLIFQFGKIFLIKERLQMAARYGVWLSKSDENINSSVENFLTKETPSFSKNNFKILAGTKSLSAYYPSKSYSVSISCEINPVKFLKNKFPKIIVEEHCVLTGDPWKYGIPKK